MKIGALVGGCAMALTVLAFGLTRPTQHPLTIKIVAFNDFHGNLQAGSYAPVAGEPAVTAGGIDYFADPRSQIQEGTARLRELNEAIHRTYVARRDEWRRACTEFHRRFDELAYPGGLDRSLKELKTGDAFAIDLAVMSTLCSFLPGSEERLRAWPRADRRSPK